jgi:hypothetical protein
VQDDYSELILSDFRVKNYGLLSGNNSHTDSLLGNLNTWHHEILRVYSDHKRRFGGLKRAMIDFHSHFPQWARPLWSHKKKPKKKLEEAIAIARDHSLVNFPANESALQLARVTKKLIEINQVRVPDSQPHNETYKKFANAWLLSEIVCPIDLWQQMVNRYLIKTEEEGVAFRNFLPFSPLFNAVANHHNWGHFRLSLNWMANMLGYYEDKNNSLLSDYNESIGKEILPGFTLEKLARELDEEDFKKFEISHLYPTRPKTSIRMSPDGTYARNHGYYLFSKDTSDSLRGKMVSPENLQSSQILDFSASSGAQSNFLVQPYHPEVWRRARGAYRQHTVFRSERTRWKAWFDFVDQNAETKPPLPNRNRPVDRRWTIELRRYRNRKYDPRLCTERPVRDKYFRGEMHSDVLECFAKFWNLSHGLDRKNEALKIANEKFSPIRVGAIQSGVHGNNRIIQVPGPEQLRYERHLNRLAQAAFAYINRKLFNQSIDLYLPGCAPWMDTGLKFKKWTRRHRHLPILNFDVKSCYDSIDLQKQNTINSIESAIWSFRDQGFFDEANALAIIFLDYYIPLLLDDSGFGYLHRGRHQHQLQGIPHGLTLSPFLLYLVLSTVFFHLEDCKRRGLIVGWTVAGDDFVVVGKPGMNLEERNEVYQFIEKFRIENGFKFHHWKNYKESGGLVQSFSKRIKIDFSQPWIAEFPLYHLPLYHAGVAVFKGKITPNVRFAGEDIKPTQQRTRIATAIGQIKRDLYISERERRSNLYVPTALCHRAFVDPLKNAEQLVNSFAASPFGTDGKELAQLNAETTPDDKSGIMSTSGQADPERGNRRRYADEYQALSQGPLTNSGGMYLAQRADSKMERWCLQFPPEQDRMLREEYIAKFYGEIDKDELRASFPFSSEIEASLIEQYQVAIKNDRPAEASKVLGEYQLRARQICCFKTISENPLGIPDDLLISAAVFFGDKTELSYLFLEELYEFDEARIPLFAEARSIFGASEWLQWRCSEMLDAYCNHTKQYLRNAPKLEWIQKGLIPVRDRIKQLAEYLKGGCPLLPGPSVYYNVEEDIYGISKQRLEPLNLITIEPDGGPFWKIPKLLDDGPTWKYQMGFKFDYETLRQLQDETLDLMYKATKHQIRCLRQENFASIMARFCPGHSFESYFQLMKSQIPKVEGLLCRIGLEQRLREAPSCRRHNIENYGEWGNHLGGVEIFDDLGPNEAQI